MSGILDDLPYILRKHTLKDEMPAVEEQELLFKRASRKKDEAFFNNILAVVSDSWLGTKVMRTALEFADEFGAELTFVSPTNLSEEMLAILRSSGVPHNVLPKSPSIDRDVIFLVRKHGFDLVIVPERFGEKIKKISVATSQIVKSLECSVMVVK